jgi:hypothetical protein
MGEAWLRQRRQSLEALGAKLRENRDLLDDSVALEEMSELVRDRVTSVDAMKLIAEVGSPRGLDLLYDVWSGTKDRNDTTRLAEALLLAKDVRVHAPPPLALAIALREKPTRCDQVRELVDIALREGDERSSPLLVRTAARKDCTDGQETRKCMDCLADAKAMKEAIRTTAKRPKPEVPTGRGKR